MSGHARSVCRADRSDLQLLDRRQVAELLGCSIRTVQRMVDRGHLAQVAVGPRLCRYRAADVGALISLNDERPGTTPTARKAVSPAREQE